MGIREILKDPCTDYRFLYNDFSPTEKRFRCTNRTRTNKKMAAERNGLLVSVLVGILQCLMAQDCDFNTCRWTIRDGLIRTNYSKLQSENSELQDFKNKTDDFGYCSKASGNTCRIRSPWLLPDPNSNTVCVFLDVYTGFKQGDKSSQITDEIVKGLLKISVTTVDSETEEKLQNISHLHHHRWDTLSTKFNYLDEKFRVVIDILLGDTDGFLALDNIKLVTNCVNNANVSQVNKTHRCTESRSFMCDDLHCVRPDQLCNLNRDCDNGKDEAEAMCGQLPVGMTCTFENSSCGWQVFKYDAKLNWTRHHGPTPTGGTGPSFDHTYGNSSGYYMYLESGDGNYMEEAVLTSRVFKHVDVLSDCKLRFFYHMYGRRIARLEVQIVNWCNMSQKPIPLTVWMQQNDQGNRWIYNEVPLNTGFKRFSVQFRAYKGILDHGDIAIDDVSFSPECFAYNYTNSRLTRRTNIRDPLPLGYFLRRRKALCQEPLLVTDTTLASANVDATDSDSENATLSTNAPNAIQSQDSVSLENKSSTTSPIQILRDSKIPLVYIVVIVIAAIITSIVIGSTVLCLALRRKKAESMSSSGRLEIMTDNPDDTRSPPPVQSSSFDMQLRCTVTELNPNYDFINAKYPEHQLREIPRNKLKLTKLIGQGAFGEVYEGTLKNLCANVDQLQVAVKTLPALCSEQAEGDFTMEAVIISKFMHKNVVKCLGVCFEDHPRYIILELLQGGDMRSFLRDSRPKDEAGCLITMEDLVKLSLDVANGCRHLEEKRFIHRDIAARNCLLTSRGPERIAKIADFGMSRDIYSADYYRKGGKTMLPIKWMPPEAFLDGVFTTKTDVWSFGILLWEIFTLGYMPYPGQTNTDVMHYVASGGRLDPPDNCPARLNKIMIMCWNSLADIRPSFSEIIEHLDMCLQDPEVMNADLSLCHLSMGEYFKDAATLAKTDTPSSAENTIPTPSMDLEDISAEFRGHVESQSTEPLLQP